jgi:uncharacterized phage protein (TIGR01671 family)
MRQECRIWDSDTKSWYEPNYVDDKLVSELLITPAGNLVMLHVESGQTMHESWFPDKYDISYYTHIKDKNDKKIFEGDLIEFNGGLWEIRFGLTSWEMREHTKFITDLLENWLYTNTFAMAEIIGNIYENPEMVVEE